MDDNRRRAYDTYVKKKNTHVVFRTLVVITNRARDTVRKTVNSLKRFVEQKSNQKRIRGKNNYEREIARL